MNPAQVKKLDVPIALQERRELTEPDGIRIQIITSGKEHRVVAAIDGHTPTNIVDAYDLLLKAKMGQPLTITFADGKTQTLAPRPTPLPDAIVEAKAKLGLTVELLTPMLADKYHLNQEDGIFVDAVARDGIGARAGLQPGDILVQLGQFRISALLNRLPASGRVQVGVVRGDESGFATLDFGGEQAD
jgi:membrane-associated protease RseP (regulator of RpoE activity)